MYSQSEIQSAIDAGVIQADAIAALDKHVSGLRDSPVQDEEHFRLVTGFNDIFVAIAAIIMLFAAGGIGNAIHYDFSGIFVAATAWGLAEYFTLKRRMAFPSIILLLAFVGGIFVSVTGFLTSGLYLVIDNNALNLMITGVVMSISTMLHWIRFNVPITIAACSGALALTIISVILIPFSDALNYVIALSLVLIGGLCIFAYAMWWDISDKSRETRRSDIAFWLHLLAAPMIAHPLFYFIGATGGDEISGLQAFGVVGTYIIMGIIVIDRRAILVSALAYILVALAILFNKFGAIELNVALTAFMIGSALLILSAF